MRRDLYFTACLIAILAITIVSIAFGKPVPAPGQPQPPKQAKPKELPDLAFDCHFGTIYQNGTTLSVLGGPHWTALGHIRQDGSVYLLWTDSGGNVAHGVYQVTDKNEMYGHWGYAAGCAVGEDGELKGSFSPERLIRPVPPMGPEF